MGYILEFRDEEQYADVMEKAYEAKEAICELCEAMDKVVQSNGMEESETEYRGGMYRRGGSYRDGGNYRGGMRRRSGRYGY